MKAWFALVLLLSACDRRASSAATTASAAPTSAPQRSPAPVSSGITPFPADPNVETPLDLGPAADSASPRERVERLFELVRGQTPAEKLLLGHTDPGQAFDYDQFRSLTTSVTLGSKLPGRRGAAAVGQPRILAGDLEGQPLARVLSGMRPVFRSCYNKALQLDSKLEGQMVLRVEVDRSGALSKVTVVTAPPRTVELKRCVVARVQASRLEPLARGDSAVFDVPVTFAVEGGE